jgi:hypothetical protein
VGAGLIDCPCWAIIVGKTRPYESWVGAGLIDCPCWAIIVGKTRPYDNNRLSMLGKKEAGKKMRRENSLPQVLANFFPTK